MNDFVLQYEYQIYLIFAVITYILINSKKKLAVAVISSGYVVTFYTLLVNEIEKGI